MSGVERPVATEDPIVRHARDAADLQYLKRREVMGLAVVLSAMSGAAAVMTAAQVLTAFRARRFCQNRIGAGMARLILGAFGVEVDVVDPDGLLCQPGPRVYIANHTSTLDFFIVTALGLPNIRGFMARKNAAFLPVGVMGVMLQHFFLPGQDDPEGRRAVFQRAERVLRETQEPVFLTPEGTRHLDGRIGPFNKGAFHMALALGWAIQPIFIDIAPELNPGKGFKTRPGRVIVRVQPPISPAQWSADTPETIQAFADHVRERYVAYPEGWST